nr:DUF1499 domain-containing protein [Frigidibacter sp. ROC022]
MAPLPSRTEADDLSPRNSFAAVLTPADPGAEMARLDARIRATPRTRVLAGSPAEGRVSYVTRSLLWGFPDITDLWLEGAALHLRGHAVYGRSDLGVNRRRIETWLAGP